MVIYNGFISVSCYFISVSYTHLEAMSMGLTVISTPVEGLIDYLIPGKNGYLFEKNNAEEFAQGRCGRWPMGCPCLQRTLSLCSAPLGCPRR